MAGGAAALAAAAAAAAARREEEDMTPYGARDLAEDWEFKILRSVSGRFRDPAWLAAVLQEEARAGWTLVEKFDDTRVRLKRPASARAGDAALDFDPRRTWVGMSQARFAALVVLAALGGSALIIVAVILGVFFARSRGLL